jgi:hypothetical protein
LNRFLKEKSAMTQAHSHTVGGVPYRLLAASPGKPFSPIYRQQNETGGNLVSVNAGDNGLYVGGGTINLAFSKQAADPGAYTAIHTHALTQARAGIFVNSNYAATDPVRLVSVLLPPTDQPSASGGTAETVFLDIFSAGMTPHHAPSNYAMLYLVPPFGPGYASDQDFLDAVTRSAVNIITLIAGYNATLVPAHAGLQSIPVLRTCLYSSSGYKRATVTRDQVALAVYGGFNTQLLAAGAASGIQMVEFENGAGEFSAVP